MQGTLPASRPPSQQASPSFGADKEPPKQAATAATSLLGDAASFTFVGPGTSSGSEVPHECLAGLTISSNTPDSELGPTGIVSEDLHHVGGSGSEARAGHAAEVAGGGGGKEKGVKLQGPDQLGRTLSMSGQPHHHPHDSPAAAHNLAGMQRVRAQLECWLHMGLAWAASRPVRRCVPCLMSPCPCLLPYICPCLYLYLCSCP